MSRQLADLRQPVTQLEQISTRLEDAVTLLALAAQEDVPSVTADIEQELPTIDRLLQTEEKNLRFNGPHDRSGAVVTIQAGAGGTDAQDWAQMLERMYMRFAENRGWGVKMIDRSLGDQAGIKHGTFEIQGGFAYGTLQPEHGVHRLVRLSPFNADHLRQTSFARVEVIPRLDPKEAPIIDPKDLEVNTFRASGAGGQHVNKTSSAVRIRHIPTGLVVQCQNERSQGQNKQQALAVLQAKLQVLAEEQHVATIDKLRGPRQAAAWGNQIRSYVMHPYTLVKDHRSKVEVSDVEKVLNGDLSAFIR